MTARDLSIVALWAVHRPPLQLERDLQPKLNLPLIGKRGSHFSKIGIPQRGAVRSAGPFEVRRVGEIERFEPEFSANALPHAEFPEHRKIKVDETRTIENITSGCAIGSGGRRLKHADVEPFLAGSDATQHAGFANQIRPIGITRSIEAGAADPDV